MKEALFGRMLLFLWLLSGVAHVQGLHVSPVQTISLGKNVIDVSGLGRGTAFYDSDNLEIQLIAGGPTWNLTKVKGSVASGKPFYGVDGNTDCRMLRHVDEFGDEFLAGYVQDMDAKMWYEIVSDAYGFSTVITTPLDDIPVEADPVEVVPFSIAGIEVPSMAELYQTLFLATAMSSIFNQEPPIEETIEDGINEIFFDPIPVTANIMVIWTEASECRKSGLAKGCSLSGTTKGTMVSAIKLAVENTNDAFSNSNIGLSLDLVYLQRDDSGYEEQDFFSALNDLAGVLDFSLTYVHLLRVYHDADIVAMIIADEAYCGVGRIGYPIPGISSMFSLTGHACTSGYTFAHEVGHNCGCRHDRGTSDACLNPFATNYGYRDPAGKFRTVMAYQCERGQCDSYSGDGGCGRIPWFSNPGTKGGRSLGGLFNNCAAQIRNVRIRVALMCGGFFDLQCLCFSPTATAFVEGSGHVSMQDIRVGDRVLTASGHFQPVYAIDHFHRSKPTEFLQIHTSTQNNALELSAQHMLFVNDRRNPIPATLLQVGDFVRTPHGPLEVLDITTVIRNGLYSPLTADGTIIVDGIAASTYSAFLGTEYIEIGGWKVMSHQSFVHLVMTPYRTVCSLGMPLNLCASDENAEEHFALYSRLGVNLLSFWRSQNFFIQFLVFGLFVILFGIMNLLLQYFGLTISTVLFLEILGNGCLLRSIRCKDSAVPIHPRSKHQNVPTI